MFAGIGLASVIAWAMGLFHIYTAGFGLLTAMLQRGVHLTFALVLIFMLYPFKPNWRWGRVLDALFVGLALLVGFYMAIYASPAKLTERALVGLSPLDLAIGALLVLLLLEATRRVCGNGLVILALVFICYAYFGRDLPSLLAIPELTQLPETAGQACAGSHGVEGMQQEMAGLAPADGITADIPQH